MMKKRLLVSACLLGYECNYKGCCDDVYEKDHKFWDGLFDKYDVIPVCSEQLGGMTTPRIPSELTGNAEDVYSGKEKVISKTGTDVTANFKRGAGEILRLAKVLKVDGAVLKSKSPSCGISTVYDGTFTGKLVKGSGMTAYALKSHGIKVVDEKEMMENSPFDACEKNN